ncbi:uncharacterized protein LOC120420742 [Culex pipiens pallens]|uniref:uncharacterized protein LOC120420742 n=1 Tax=Culex pipiens pallens TaxID=42434 RepID=UPI001954E5C6|nr:uncharacterized protein LOC120420742 [Culex pipiens pallens]
MSSSTTTTWGIRTASRRQEESGRCSETELAKKGSAAEKGAAAAAAGSGAVAAGSNGGCSQKRLRLSRNPKSHENRCQHTGGTDLSGRQQEPHQGRGQEAVKVYKSPVLWPDGKKKAHDLNKTSPARPP